MEPIQAWSLVTFKRDGREDEAGIMLSDGSVVQPEVLAPYRGLIEALQDWGILSTKLKQLDPTKLDVLDDVERLAPLRFPRKLLCSGANYSDHVAEMGDMGMPEGSEPFFFLVPPSTTLLPSGSTVEIPADPGANIDWEAELAVVIGARATNVSREDAHRYVAGYAAFNDISARGYLRRPVSLAPPFAFDWLACKGLDGFCPMGPITPAWMIPDPHALSVRCTVDGAVKQNGRTSSMIFDVWNLISKASRQWTLEPGDIIATGTPAGVGAASKTFLKGGEEVVVEIEGCAPLKTPIRLRGSKSLAA